MSEHKVGEFVRGHKRAEIVAGVGIVAAAGAVLGLRKGAAAFGLRKKLHHELHTFSGADMSERLKIFKIVDEEELILNAHTILGAKIYETTLDGENGGIVIADLIRDMSPDEEYDAELALKDLTEHSFIEKITLGNGLDGYKATPDLVEAINEGKSEALSQYFYYHA